MILNRNSQIISCERSKPIQYAVSALYRDMKAVFTETDAPGDSIRLAKDSDLAPECFCLQVQDNELLLTAAGRLGSVPSFSIFARYRLSQCIMSASTLRESCFAFRAALTSAPNVSKPGQSSIFAILHHPYTFYSSWTIGEMMQSALLLNFIVHSLSIVL